MRPKIIVGRVHEVAFIFAIWCAVASVKMIAKNVKGRVSDIVACLSQFVEYAVVAPRNTQWKRAIYRCLYFAVKYPTVLAVVMIV